VGEFFAKGLADGTKSPSLLRGEKTEYKLRSAQKEFRKGKEMAGIHRSCGNAALMGCESLCRESLGDEKKFRNRVGEVKARRGSL